MNYPIILFIILVVFLVWRYIFRQTDDSFIPQVVGTVSNITPEKFVEYVTKVPAGQVRSISIMSKDVYRHKQAQMIRAIELYSLLDDTLFPKIWNQIFNAVSGRAAAAGDLGGMFLSHYNNAQLEIYTMAALERGAPIMVTNSRYDSYAEADNDIHDVYRQLQSNFGDYLIIIISGPNFPDVDQTGRIFIGETTLDVQDEPFGMYSGSLESWLSYHKSFTGADNPRYQIPDVGTHIRTDGKRGIN